jgi:hypothetical protein
MACARSPEAVTLESFRSLRFEQTGGIAGLRTTLTIEAGGRAEYRFGASGAGLFEVKQLSPQAMRQLVAVLDRNRFLGLSGSYTQHGADLFQETVILVVADGRSEVRNQGENAPRRYLNVRDYLLQLIAREFPPR